MYLFFALCVCVPIYHCFPFVLKNHTNIHNPQSHARKLQFNCELHAIRRGSSQDIRDRSPDYGSMGRKQRFVLSFLFYCLDCTITFMHGM